MEYMYLSKKRGIIMIVIGSILINASFIIFIIERTCIKETDANLLIDSFVCLAAGVLVLVIGIRNLITATRINRINKKLKEENSVPRRTDTVPENVNSVSAYDEIKKLKELLDMGAITQQEYDAKKKQLLNL